MLGCPGDAGLREVRVEAEAENVKVFFGRANFKL